jgi:hypothetical protein
MASAANAATTARRKSGEGIMARRLHLAVERPWRGRIEQNGLFGPGPEQLPRSNMSIPRSIGQPAKYKLDINLKTAKTALFWRFPNHANPLHRLQ